MKGLLLELGVEKISWQAPHSPRGVGGECWGVIP